MKQLAVVSNAKNVERSELGGWLEESVNCSEQSFL